MSKNVRCPLCGRDFTDEPLKNWKFNFYDVKRFQCAYCEEKFNVYESPKSTFTIPKAKQ